MAYTTINKSTDHFNTVTYTGTGSAQSITGVGFRPDWVWGKNRSTTNYHNLEDVVRGAGKRLSSNVTEAETTESVNFTSFDSDGFTVGTGDNVNKNGSNIVVWNWLAGGAGSSNTDGTINSTVSVNTTAGFSIVKYTGTGSAGTIGHGLGVAPKMIIVKCLDATKAWTVYHSALGSSAAIFLEQTSAATTSNTTYFGGTDPTTSVFSIGSSTNVTNSGDEFIAYCFAEKTGYSKFGSYTGNNNADGTFVYTGFKPSFIMIKSSSAGGDNAYSWSMFDNKRSSYNIERAMLKANLSDAEYTSGSNADIDILSNGFKMRASPNETNGSNTYIYMAFGQSLVGSNNVPCVAR